MWQNKTSKEKLQTSSVIFFVIGILATIATVLLVMFGNQDNSWGNAVYILLLAIGVIGPCLIISVVLLIMSFFVKPKPVLVGPDPVYAPVGEPRMQQTINSNPNSFLRPPFARLLSTQRKLNIAYIVCAIALLVRIGFNISADMGVVYGANAGTGFGSTVLFFFLASLDFLSSVLFFATALVAINGLLTSPNRHKIVPGLLFLAFAVMLLVSFA